MRQVLFTAILGLAAFHTTEASADCKLIIVMDRSSSMMNASEAPAASGASKCTLSQRALKTILDNYELGNEFDIRNSGRFPLDYINNCDGTGPTQRKLVWIWEFLDAATIRPVWTGVDFKTVGDARAALFATGWYTSTPAHDALGQCPGPSTPLGQSMCKVANRFPNASSPPSGEQWVVKVLTDGAENASQSVTVFDAGETHCRLSTDPVTDTLVTPALWRGRVEDEYTSRRIIQTDTVLFGPGGATQTILPGDGSTETSPAAALGQVSRFSAGAVSVPPTPDEAFFGGLASVTGGTFQSVRAVVSPVITLVDSDGDGVPDFRDKCSNGACAADFDQDQIPDSIDLCPTVAEDGLGPSGDDGCPDSDADGVRNAVDQCPTLIEDGRQPFPSDGCPTAHWSGAAAPGLTTKDNGIACTSLSVAGQGDASPVSLDIAGTHTFRSVLRGTLAHNGITVTAFPIQTFPASGGAFGFTNRAIPGLFGNSAGTWTLCIADTDPFGDTGVLSTWSVHF